MHVRSVVVGFVVAAAALAIVPRSSYAQPAASPVPRVVKVGGTIPGGRGAVTVVLSLYRDQAGDTPLWTETQAVACDESGRFTALLGASLPAGLPADLFASGDPRWLGVRAEGEAEQPRVLLVSVPYALKAGDADTIGGRPLSAFVLAGDTTGKGPDGLTYVDARVLKNGLSGAASPPQGAGSPGHLGVFTDTTNLGDSVVFQSGTNIGVNTTAPMAPFHSVAAAAPGALFDVYSNSLGALPVVYRAARGTPASPSAVQTDDILGGLAVRGYGAIAFTSGRGQVMFRAAENWTDAANGTYLEFTTTPIGSATWQERMRITPDGRVGIGVTRPSQLLSVAGEIESTAGGFRFPDGTTQATALSLGANAFTATQTITSGNLALPATGGGGSGVITVGGQPFLHGFGSWNLFAGAFAGGGFLATGASNTGLGGMSLFSLTTGSYNTAVGRASLTNLTTGGSNTAVGGEALTATTTGGANSAFGAGALKANTTANDNSAFGYNSLASNTTGQSNSAFGKDALLKNVDGGANSAFGAGALKANTTANDNSAFGYNSMASNTTGFRSSAFGKDALLMSVDGTDDTAVGVGALYNLTNGYRNTAIGAFAGGWGTTGVNNTSLGYHSGPDPSTPTVSNATAIGAYATVTQSNSLILGNTDLYPVNVGIGTSAPDTKLQVVGDIKVGTAGTNGCLKNFSGGGIVGTCSSDLRLKENIQSFGPVLDKVARLQPVHFTWRAREFPEYHFGEGLNSGLVAQDVEKLFPELVETDGRGYKMVNYAELPYLTLQAVKELKADNDALRVRLGAADEQTRRLAAQVEALTRAVAELQKRRE